MEVMEDIKPKACPASFWRDIQHACHRGRTRPSAPERIRTSNSYPTAWPVVSEPPAFESARSSVG